MAFNESDQSSRIDRAFAENRLLSTFAPDARALLDGKAEILDLELGDIVLERGRQVDSSLFPFGQTVVSMAVDVDGRWIEVASVGNEGAIGGIISCGHAPAYTRATVLIAGPALKVPMAVLEAAKRESGLIGNLFCRYSDFLLAQVMQSAACNVFHSVQARTATWLLTAQDRAGSRLELTQEALAGLLGAQRTTVNAAARSLQDLGLIELRRGAIHIIDRDGLKRIACECYSRLEQHFEKVIGTRGVGNA